MKRLFVIAAFLLIVCLIVASTAIGPPHQGEIYIYPTTRAQASLTYIVT